MSVAGIPQHGATGGNAGFISCLHSCCCFPNYVTTDGCSLQDPVLYRARAAHVLFEAESFLDSALAFPSLLHTSSMSQVQLVLYKFLYISQNSFWFCCLFSTCICSQICLILVPSKLCLGTFCIVVKWL